MTDTARGEASRARRDYRGPAILGVGFRPFFLGAALWSLAALTLWIAALAGGWSLPSAFDPLTWHGHEMVFGYVAAVIAGFLLTAIPNWTGRLPVRGSMLGLLFGVWLAGRAAVAVSALIGPLAAAVIDVSFLVVFCGLVAREILVGRNWRNLPVVAIVGGLAGANLLVHLEFLDLAATATLGLRLGIAVVLVLITLIGGRIVPSFTRNWLKKRGAGALPAPFGHLDRLAIAITLATALAWVAAPDSRATAIAGLLAAAVHAVRLARWRGRRSLAEPLVWVLHLGYAWLVAGFALLGLSLLGLGPPPTAALHALTAGAMGTMTLAVMTRASLGHSGRPLTAGPGTTAIYGLVTAAALLRVAAPLQGGASLAVTGLAAACWIGAFGLFVALYGPLFWAPRR
jgi:uncharacterized protein involved in response to NO